MADLHGRVVAEFPETTLDAIIPSPSPLYYRNKMEFSFGTDHSNLIVGLKQKNSYSTIIDLKTCQLQSPLTVPILRATIDFFQAVSVPAWSAATQTGILRYIILRHSKSVDQWMIVLVVSEPISDLLGQYATTINGQFSSVVSVWMNHHAGRSETASIGSMIPLWGERSIQESVAGIHYAIGPRTFFQVNPVQANRIIDTIIRLGQPLPTDRVLDLYCGIGTIALAISSRVKSVIGIECVLDSVLQATQNAKMNGILNCQFWVGNVRSALKNRPLHPTLVIVDPPRCGLSPKEVVRIIEQGPDRVIYVSCNPTTFFINAAQFVANGYQLTDIQPIDMFPNTPHVELVARFCR